MLDVKKPTKFQFLFALNNCMAKDLKRKCILLSVKLQHLYFQTSKCFLIL